MIEDQDDDGDFGTKRGISGPAKNKKGASTALIGAVSILASAKSDEEERKYTFLGEHLQQQGELRQKELDLERERLEMEREKNRMEERRTPPLSLIHSVAQYVTINIKNLGASLKATRAVYPLIPLPIPPPSFEQLWAHIGQRILNLGDRAVSHMRIAQGQK